MKKIKDLIQLEMALTKGIEISNGIWIYNEKKYKINKKMRFWMRLCFGFQALIPFICYPLLDILYAIVPNDLFVSLGFLFIVLILLLFFLLTYDYFLFKIIKPVRSNSISDS